ncbi:MAG: flagellin FliC [Deltaproteobacteria bacterium]|nr:flagellin FliC [Deltaproteobacteria bacterium]
MGMRIRTNVMSLVAQRHLTNNSNNVGESVEKLASGQRINRSKDDSAGLAISETMRGRMRGLDQAKRNASDAVSMLQVAEGGMAEMTNLLIRMRELTVQAATDTVGDAERGFLNREYTQLADEIDRIAATTEFNGRKFFVSENSLDKYTIQVGTNWDETGVDTIGINLEGLRFNTETLGLGKESEIGPLEGTEGPMRDEIANKLSVIDTSLGMIAKERANLGALQSRFDTTINNLSTSVENLGAAKSRITDTDFAAETANLAKNQILSQASLSVLAQANQIPEMALTLLR